MKRKYADVKGRPFLLVPVIDERLKKVPLDPVVTLVFGFLMYLARKGNSTSRTAVSRHLRLDKKAADRAVRILIDGGCVVEEGRRIRAVDPQGASATWFRRQSEPTGEAWHEQFIYDRVYLPRSTSVLSVRTNALFWHLMKLGYAVDSMPGYHQVGGNSKRPPPFLTVEYLAQGLRCYRKTIARGLKRLLELNLIRIHYDGNRRFGDSQKRFVIGIPPIGTSADLWRDSWTRSRTEDAITEVTAESLFGLPSRDTLKPSTEYDAGAGRYIRAYGITGKVADEIVTKIVKYRIEPREWQSLLQDARRDHESNRERNPERLPMKHCGFLFKHMLEEYIVQQKARVSVAGARSPLTSPQMKAESSLASMRFSNSASLLLREAVEAEHFDLPGGRCVPCRLHWDAVVDLLKQAGQDAEAFKRGVAESIFNLSGGIPECDWLRRWLALKPIPEVDQGRLSRFGFSPKESRTLLQHTRFLVERKVRDDDPATLNGIVDGILLVACWQGRKGMTADAMEHLIDDIGQVLDRTSRKTDEVEIDPEEVRVIREVEVEDFCFVD